MASDVFKLVVEAEIDLRVDAIATPADAVEASELEAIGARALEVIQEHKSYVMTGKAEAWKGKLFAEAWSVGEEAGLDPPETHRKPGERLETMDAPVCLSQEGRVNAMLNTRFTTPALRTKFVNKTLNVKGASYDLGSMDDNELDLLEEALEV